MLVVGGMNVSVFQNYITCLGKGGSIVFLAIRQTEHLDSLEEV